MADGKNPIDPTEEKPKQINYGQGLQQLTEFINNTLSHLERPELMQWKQQRIKTVKTLNELRTKLDIVCVGANYGKGVGGGAQLVGIYTKIVGAVMALGKSPSAATVMNVGSLINNSGAVVGGVSNIVESYASAKFLLEVKAVLDEDKELSKPVQEWLVFSQSLDASMKNIFGSDLNSVIKNNGLKIFSEFTRLYKPTRDFHATLENMNKGQYAMHIGNDVIVDKLLKFSKELDISPQLGDTIQKLSESLSLLQVAQDGVKVYKNLFGESASTTENLPTNQMPVVSGDSDGTSVTKDDETVESASNNNAPFQAGSPSVNAVSTFCVFQAIDIANIVVSLISTAMVIRDGKSMFSEAIKQISDLLEAELRSVEKLG